MPVASSRYYPLVDEIKYHVFNWATDSEWKKLPPKVVLALNALMNELKIYEALKESGEKDLSDEKSDVQKKKQFIALFKKGYLEITNMPYEAPVNSINQMNISRTIQSLEREGATYVEFIDWFFNDFCSIEENKKFLPPTINFMCNYQMTQKYLFKMKDQLRMRRENAEFQKIRTRLLEIALPFAEKLQEKEFSKKVLDFSEQKIPVTKFFELLKNFAKKSGDLGVLEKCRQYESEKQDKSQ